VNVYAQDLSVGPGAACRLTINHGLGTMDIVSVSVWVQPPFVAPCEDRAQVQPGIAIADENSIYLDFSSSNDTYNYRVVIAG
jgi:hypothetical protein